jgi:16S rRNA (cytidine1402-2'-O)-methyltransferase
MELFLVPTPVGNLADMTFRAVATLQQVDVILCEDTRTSSVLLKHYDISKPLTPYHQHNEHKIVQHLVDQMLAGKSFALITDAGTPGISDPGFLLLRECRRNNIKVTCLPGPTAFVPALVQSGFPCSQFIFEGFLPVKKGRQTAMKALLEENRTVIFYESPHRLAKTLREMAAILGVHREASVVREISKKFEETQTGTLGSLSTYFEANAPKGEIVLLIGGSKHSGGKDQTGNLMP